MLIESWHENNKKCGEMGLESSLVRDARGISDAGAPFPYVVLQRLKRKLKSKT